MPTWPIPSNMIQTGNGPGAIPQRDLKGNVPGVPVIYRQTMSDEVASLVRQQLPSGWMKPGALKGSIVGETITPGVVSIDPQDENLEGFVYGYRFNLGRDPILLDLPAAPMTGTRDDLIFLEMWFERAGRQGRTLVHRWRVAAGADFATHPDGLGSTGIKARGARADETTAHFQKTLPAFDLGRDAGLYMAALPGQANDPLTEQGNDGALYEVIFAMPVARVRRNNQVPFHPVTNPNGANGYESGAASMRPDGAFHNAVTTDYHLIDLRRVLAQGQREDRVFQRALVDYLTHTLTTGGARRLTIASLASDGFGAHYHDAAATQVVSLPNNLVRYSHFEADTDGNGLADGWTSYSTDGGAGTYSVTADGQLITETAGRWGITQALTGFHTNKLAVQVAFKPTAYVDGASLIVEGVRGDGSVLFSFVQSLSGLALNAEAELFGVHTADGYETAFSVNIYVFGAPATVVVRGVDIKATDRRLPVVKVDNGTSATVLHTARLAETGSTYLTAGATATATHDGSAIVVTPSLEGDDLKMQLGSIPARRDFLMKLTISHPAGSGMAALLDRPVRVWDADGFIAFVESGAVSQPLGTAEVGQSVSASQGIVTYNPETDLRGVVTTVTAAGDGGGTYTLPATQYGRKLLLPLTARIDANPVLLSTVLRNSNGTLAVTVADGVVVLPGQTLSVDVVTDAPVVVYSRATNGLKGLYRAVLAETIAETTNTVIHVPVPGVSKGAVPSVVCSSVYVDGTAVSLAEPTAIAAANVPVAAITFANPVAEGARVQLVVLVQTTFDKSRATYFAYDNAEAPVAPLGASESITILTEPVLLAHTKGSAAADGVSNYGPLPIRRDASLGATPIRLAGLVAPERSTVLNIPIATNVLKGLPLYAGRVLTVSDLADASLLIEGAELQAETPHRTVVACLVAHKGAIHLLLVESSRADDKTRVSSGADVMFLTPNSRPAAVV